MQTNLEVLFTPADFGTLASRDLSQTVCVVFDILRATTTIVTALAHGATAVIPVAEITEALALRGRRAELLLAGERNGLRIGSDLTGGTEFDLGNSPREFTAERVAGRTIVITTTNGTRALRACSGANTVLVGSLLNLASTAKQAIALKPSRILVVCSGTLEQASLEDAVAAGAFCDLVWAERGKDQAADSALIARDIYRGHRQNLEGALGQSRNGRRLSTRPELQPDVAYCAQVDVLEVVVRLDTQGVARISQQT